jgi:serine/threonine protein kinase
MGSEIISFKLDEWYRQIKEDWSRQGSSFGRHVDFPDGHVFKMPKGEGLGSGGFGHVRSTECEYEYNGKTRKTVLALKKFYTRPKDVQESIWREISILKRLRHRHVTEFVGSYTKNGKLYGLYWPVAPFSLADVFDHLVAIGTSIGTDGIDPDTAYQNVPDTCSWKTHAFDLAKFRPSTEGDLVRYRSISSIVDEAVGRLFGGLGCLAEALEYIHGQKVRHSDLKPANILMFPSNDSAHDCGPYDPDGVSISDGIRITDFNLARGMGTLSFSRTHTVGGTVEYSAPEQMGWGDKTGSGPPADVFSLGCIFLEILCMLSIEPALAKKSLPFCSPMDLDMPNPNGSRCYAGNIQNFDRWTTRLAETGASPIKQHLISLVESMMDKSPQRRPIAKQVAIRLAVMEQLRATARGGIGETKHSLFGRCCKPATFEREDYRLLRHIFPANVGGTDVRPLPYGGEALDQGDSSDEFDVDTPTTARSRVASFVASIDGGSPVEIERRQPVAYWNRHNQRIDPTPVYSQDKILRIGGLKLCNNKYLLDACLYGDSCIYNHDYEATDEELRILRQRLRSTTICNFGLLCNDPICIYGHHCQNSIDPAWNLVTKTMNCQYNGPPPNGTCRFPADLHDLDTKITYCT